MQRIKTCSDRRLREGNKDNWLDELAHSEREIASLIEEINWPPCTRHDVAANR